MMVDLNCYSGALMAVIGPVACFDGLLFALAFFQLIRIHRKESRRGWTRQKVFHLIIGSSSMGSFVYFVLTPVATCKGWPCWSQTCGFLFMGLPRILFLAAFLLLLSYWLDLCHQASDEFDEDDFAQEALLQRSDKPDVYAAFRKKCCSFLAIHVGKRQKVVILVTALNLLLTIATAVLIWIGMGENPIDSAVVTRVYVDIFSILILSLGGALAFYGVKLILRMRGVRSERVASEVQKIAGIAITSVLCFTSMALVALFTDIPMLYKWDHQHANGASTFILLIIYYFIGSSVPSAILLWVLRELPPSAVVNRQPTSRIVIYHEYVDIHTRRWTNCPLLQNQASRASPI